MPENVEIERRFLVDGRHNRPWVDQSMEQIHITQWYLDSTQLIVSEDDGTLSYSGITLITNLASEVCQILKKNSHWTVRIRKWNNTYLLTLKGPRAGAIASEYEWEIQGEIANNIIQHSTYPLIEKNRFLWKGDDDLLWEIDEFEGNLAGLIIAEVELEDEGAELIIPNWAGMELTYLKGWSNAALVKMLSQE